MSIIDKFNFQDIQHEDHGNLIIFPQKDKPLTKTHLFHNIKVEFFGKFLSKYLNNARKRNLFNDLIIVSSPRFLGILNSNIDQNTARRINKELTSKEKPEILKLEK